MKPLPVLALTALLMAACSTAGPATTSAPSHSQGGPDTPTVSPQLTTASAVDSQSPAPEVANVVVEKTYSSVWDDVGFTRWQVIAHVKNVGTGWARLDWLDSNYAILAADGSVTSTDMLLYAAPDYLAPGAEGWLMNDGLADGSSDDMTSAQVDVQFKQATDPGPGFSFRKVKVRDTSGDMLSATGFITNESSVVASFAAVVVVMFDAKGKPLGFLHSDGQAIGPGETQAFSGEDSLYFSASKVKSTKVFAFDETW